MKNPKRSYLSAGGIALWLAVSSALSVTAAPAPLLFQDEFESGIPGWTSVQPPGSYIQGPLRWQWDIVSGSWVETSNIYTDAAGASTTATAPMLINEAETGAEFTYSARLRAGDDDGFGLIWGYQDQFNFYRVSFARQADRTGFPWTGWNVDRKTDNTTENLFGASQPDFVNNFTLTDGQPFDVIIQVSAENLLNLRVIDDPDGAATEIILVDDQPLPSSAAGRVGLFTWGMSGGPPPASFQITNLDLEPVDLVNYPPSGALSEWTHVLPPRADGTASLGGHGQGIWGLVLDENGPTGTLGETSDAFGGNDAQAQTVGDYVASTLVAGETTWTDYILWTRIIPHDDDGHGVVLRYQDDQNFYRIALRRQTSGNGIRSGVSVQKVVGGFWEEVFFEDTPVFVPQNDVPYDLIASIHGNSLRILIINNPEDAAEVFSYGPIDVTGATVDSGKIGLFSWAMSWTEIDFVRVYEVPGIPLIVSSPFGDPDPASGVHSFTAGEQVNATVISPSPGAEGVRHVVTGWDGIGSVPATGSNSSVLFNINDISILNWNWSTEYRLAVTAGSGGTVDPAAEEWVEAGAARTITAEPGDGFAFSGWSGTTASSSPTLSLTMNGPVTLTAHFTADSDNDSLPDDWELRHFGDLSAITGGDPDGDAWTNLQEFEQGTNPNFSEIVIVEDGLENNWVHGQRDPGLPGRFLIQDFGPGFRGAFETSNHYRWATDGSFIGAENTVDQVSFQGPYMVISDEAWDTSWNNYTAQATYAVGDNDGIILYFRYQDPMNWYRVTVVGEEDNGNPQRAPVGVSVQKRVDGVFSQVLHDETFRTDPLDEEFFKYIRITVTANENNFSVNVTGWDRFLDVPTWTTDLDLDLEFTDDSLASGKVGVGTWGMGSNGTGATAEIPVETGVLIDDIIVTVDDQVVFEETWTTARLPDDFPSGWDIPFSGTPLAGEWEISAYQTIVQRSNAAPPTSATSEMPAADADGPVALAPAPEQPNYFMELALHPFDDDGIGFVYDFVDTDNYARVLFVSEASGATRMPQGVTVSRKSDGEWSNSILGDAAFIYTPGSPFMVQFANNNGVNTLRVWNLDSPSEVTSWTWTGSASPAGARVGITTWGEQYGDFRSIRVRGLPEIDLPGMLEITGISAAGGQVTLSIDSGGQAYDVQQTTDLAADNWQTIAENRTQATFTTEVSENTQLFWRLQLSN